MMLDTRSTTLLRKMALAFALLAPVSTACKSTTSSELSEAKPKSGPRLVQEQLPHFYDAAVATLGKAKAQELFANWGDQEIFIVSDHYGPHILEIQEMIDDGRSEDEIAA